MPVFLWLRFVVVLICALVSIGLVLSAGFAIFAAAIRHVLRHDDLEFDAKSDVSWIRAKALGELESSRALALGELHRQRNMISRFAGELSKLQKARVGPLG